MDSLSEAARMRWHLSEPRPWEAPSLESVGHWLAAAGCIVELGQFRSSSSPRPFEVGSPVLDLQGPGDVIKSRVCQCEPRWDDGTFELC